MKPQREKRDPIKAYRRHEIALWIKDNRERKGITKEYLANELGVHANTILNWESEKTTPTGTTFYECARVLGGDGEKIWAEIYERAKASGSSQGRNNTLEIDEARAMGRPVPARASNKSVAQIRVALNKLLDQAAEVADVGEAPRFVLKAQFPAFFDRDWPCFGQSQNSDEFFVWSHRTEPPAHLIFRLFRDVQGNWKSERLEPFAFNESDMILVGRGDQLVAVSEHHAKIRIRPIAGGATAEVWPVRTSMWKSVTDVKLDGSFLLLCFCGGDIWLLDLTTLQFSQIRSGTDEVDYWFADFIGRELIVLTSDHSDRLEIVSIKTRKTIQAIEMPESSNFIGSFRQHEMIAVGGITGTNFYSTKNWNLLRNDNVTGLGLFGFQKCETRGYYGIGGQLHRSQGSCQIWSAMTGRSIFKKVVGYLGRPNFAFGHDGSSIACSNPKSGSIDIWQEE